MNNLSFTVIIANGWGSRSIGIPAQGIAFADAAMNGLIFFGACYKLVRRSKEDPLANYIFSLLPGFVGAICNAIFYTVATYGKGFWDLNLAYHSFVWLSCITSFIPLSRALQEAEGASTARAVGRFFTYIAYLWAAISVCIGVGIAVLQVNATQLYYNGYRYYQVGTTMYQYLSLTLFAYFSNWAFVIMSLVLFVAFAHYLNRMPRAVKSLAAFGILATVPVITDTVILFAFRPTILTVAKAMTSMIINFIFTDCFSFFALIVALVYAESWVFSTGFYSSEDPFRD